MSLRSTMTSQRGLTLIELLTAMALSLILLTGVAMLFSANKTTYKLQEGMSIIQESGRYAISQIRADYQKAGYGGCLSPQSSPIVSNLVAGSPDYLGAIRDGTPLSGMNDVATVSIGGRNVVAGTDVLDIRGPLRSSIAYVTGPIFAPDAIQVTGNNTGFVDNEYMMIADCAGADIFRASAVTTAAGPPAVTNIAHSDAVNIQPVLTRKYGADSVVMELFIYTYFISDTGRTNDDGAAILALYREDGSGNPQELLEGVENMQITYGVDANGDNLAESFLDADAVTNWGQVVSVSVSLLINSVNPALFGDIDTPDPTEELKYTYLPLSDSKISPAEDDFRMRQEFSSVISLRNSTL